MPHLYLATPHAQSVRLLSQGVVVFAIGSLIVEQYRTQSSKWYMYLPPEISGSSNQIAVFYLRFLCRVDDVGLQIPPT